MRIDQAIPPARQMVLTPGVAEFTWGQPDPDLLPVDALRRATEAALSTAGPDLLAYGAPEGAWPLLAWIRDRVEQTEGISVGLDEIVGTGGNSDAIDQICTLFTRPRDIVLVESPTYHLALRVMWDHDLDLRPVPMDEDGLRVDVLADTIDQLSRAGTPPRLLYTIPTFHNPTGRCLSLERREALVSLAAQHDLLVLEDDVYRELAFDAVAPPSLFGLAPRGTVMRMGSFAKSLAPGLRLGWINMSAAQARRFADGGLRDSGGCPNYYAGMVVAELCRSGDFDRQVARLRQEYAMRRDALAAALREHLPAGATFTPPGGGFFQWVTLPEGRDAEALAGRAEAFGVTFLPGPRFAIDQGSRRQLRLAFSLMKPDALAEGARRLGRALAQG